VGDIPKAGAATERPQPRQRASGCEGGSKATDRTKAAARQSGKGERARRGSVATEPRTAATDRTTAGREGGAAQAVAAAAVRERSDRN